MKTNFNTGLYAFIINKLPKNLRSTENYYFFSFCISSIFWLSLLAPILGYFELFVPAWSSAICSLLIFILLILWRIGLSITWAQNTYQTILMWGILYNAYCTGGISSPLIVWLGIVPLLPLFTISRGWSIVWLSISFISVVAMYTLQINGVIPVSLGSTNRELTLSALMVGLLCIAQAILVFTYDTVNSHHIKSIELHNTNLKSLSKDLQKANEHKDKFLATVSHEMRTPLNALMGYLGLLRTTDKLPTIATSYVQGAQNSAAHLLTVINDLLDFSQIQQGKLVLSPQTVNLHQVIKETHDTLAPKAAGQAIDYTLHLDSALPQWVRIDPHRLTQIFLNLLGNALKFTNHGSVTTHVRFDADPSAPQAGILSLLVHDTGIGIPHQSFDRIFEPFVQLQTQSNIGNDNSLHGNGLGLSITKNLVVNLGGSITLDSQEGVGTTFEVRLPILLTQSPQTSKPLPVTKTYADQIYLLLVDDHATNRLVTSATIKRDLPNAEIDEARNGTEAIEKMKVNRYDLVLMDLIMPDYSGIEVTRIIRTECPSPMCDVPVVALTANVAENAIKACLDVGINEVLRKPFDREVLIRTILQHVT